MIESERIDKRIGRLFRHAGTCPRGKPIPSGKCSAAHEKYRGKSIVPLTCLKKGQEAVIAYIRAGDSKKLQKLMGMGVLPGNVIYLDRIFPSFVFSVDYSQYAVDADMAEAIFVSRNIPQETERA